MERLDEDIRSALIEYSNHPFTPVHVMSDIPVYVIHLLTQKASEAMYLNVAMSLQDFSDCMFLGEYAEKCFVRAYGEDWFLRTLGGPLLLKPKWMIYNQAASNWHLFDYYSIKDSN
jgi:hypothetical protein